MNRCRASIAASVPLLLYVSGLAWIATLAAAQRRVGPRCTLRSFLDSSPDLSLFREVARRTSSPGMEPKARSHYDGHLSNPSLANTLFIPHNTAWSSYFKEVYSVDVDGCAERFPGDDNATAASLFAGCVLDDYLSTVVEGSISGKTEAEMYITQTYRMNILARQTSTSQPIVLRSRQAFSGGRRCWKSFQAQVARLWGNNGTADALYDVCADAGSRTLSGTDTVEPANIVTPDISCGQSIIHITDSVLDYMEY